MRLVLALILTTLPVAAQPRFTVIAEEPLLAAAVSQAVAQQLTEHVEVRNREVRTEGLWLELRREPLHRLRLVLHESRRLQATRVLSFEGSPSNLDIAEAVAMAVPGLRTQLEEVIPTVRTLQPPRPAPATWEAPDASAPVQSPKSKPESLPKRRPLFPMPGSEPERSSIEHAQAGGEPQPTWAATGAQEVVSVRGGRPLAGAGIALDFLVAGLWRGRVSIGAFGSRDDGDPLRLRNAVIVDAVFGAHLTRGLLFAELMAGGELVSVNVAGTSSAARAGTLQLTLGAHLARCVVGVRFSAAHTLQGGPQMPDGLARAGVLAGVSF